MLADVTATVGWIAIVSGGCLFLAVLFWFRTRLSGVALSAAAACAGILVAVGGLLVVGDADVWSWIVAPVVLGAGAVAQQRALFAPGGPFRT